MVGEVVGVLIVSLIWALSINRERPSKYDGSLCVLLPALLTGFLYFASFFLQLNSPKKVRFCLVCVLCESIPILTTWLPLVSALDRCDTIRLV
jgi:hypothetical protein